MTNLVGAIGEVLGAVADSFSTMPGAPAKAAGQTIGTIANSFGTLGSVWDNEGYAGAAKVVAGGLGATAALSTMVSGGSLTAFGASIILSTSALTSVTGAVVATAAVFGVYKLGEWAGEATYDVAKGLFDSIFAAAPKIRRYYT